jgi:cytochrome c peroxidase
MSRVGAAEVTVTADDHFGGVTKDLFMIAVPATITSTPSLPSTSYLYRDDELPLPYVFSMSSLQVIPLWDTQPSTNRTNDAGATLGRVLFYDKRLSVTNTMSCSTCHQQSHGFASPARFDMGLLGLPMKRNSMALANVRYNIANRWFADMRVDDLRKLVGQPLQSHDELGMTTTLLVSKLQAAGYYDTLFYNAFGPGGITSDRAAAALAQFLQSLLSYRTRADQALNPMDNSTPNPSLVFTAQELSGFEIYKAHCWICHESVANTNVWQANNGLDVVPADPGVNDPALQRSGALGVFRAASLRNIAMTSPYMHDGRFTTLREVIDHYDSGIQASPDLDSLLKDSNGQPIRLNLSEADKVALESYLLTLTDDAMLADPKFADPFH